jgi:hypothetical protein
MSTSTGKKRAVISMLVLALVSVLAVAGAADAKKKHKKKVKPVTIISKKAAPIPAGTAATFDPVTLNQVTPFVEGKAQTTITVPKKKNFPIKSVEVAAIVAPASPSAIAIGVNLLLTGPSGAREFLNTPFRQESGGFTPNDPGSPAGVGYGTGTNCSGSPMRFTNNSQRDPASENPNAAFDDPGFAEFTSFPPYTTPVFDNLNAVYKGLNSKGTWKLTALNPPTFGTPAPDTTSTLVCWSLTIKPQKLPKGQSA